MIYKKTKINNFTDLNAWKEGHNLVLEVYKITKKFPKEEQFALISQIRRAVVSFTSNIAEGFGRNTFKDKAHFYSIAMGSLTEVHNQLIISRDLGYISADEFSRLLDKLVTVNKITNGLIRKSKEISNSF
jgi:four helix bundle protein